MSIKLACINIERSRHLNEVAAFLEAYRPDVLCLQELVERDIGFFENLMGQKLAFAPMMYHPAEVEPAVLGVGLVARTPLHRVAEIYYSGQRKPVPTIRAIGEGPNRNFDPDSMSRVLLAATVEGYRISTTHFTWTPRGEATPRQLADADLLLAAAQQAEQNGLVMCGDFNAPRGLATFGKIASAYTDAIPAHYKGSLDLSQHRVTKENPTEAKRMQQLMVDGLFHTPNYKVTDVKLTAGISDHMAITATINI